MGFYSLDKLQAYTLQSPYMAFKLGLDKFNHFSRPNLSRNKNILPPVKKTQMWRLFLINQRNDFCPE